MEIFGAQDELPLDLCLRELRTADVAVVIVGPHYGSLVPAGDSSYTHEEFREARRRGIPTLAFVLEPGANLAVAEQEKLDAFRNEVGQLLTFKKTTIERLSADVLAALGAAQYDGRIGHHYALFQQWPRYFRSELSTATEVRRLFNHLTPFYGRKEELNSLLQFGSSNGLGLLLIGHGGSGKSRLLLEFARASPDNAVLFVDRSADWSASDIQRLPGTPTILVIDCSHGRRS